MGASPLLKLLSLLPLVSGGELAPTSYEWFPGLWEFAKPAEWFCLDGGYLLPSVEMSGAYITNFEHEQYLIFHPEGCKVRFGPAHLFCMPTRRRVTTCLQDDPQGLLAKNNFTCSMLPGSGSVLSSCSKLLAHRQANTDHTHTHCAQRTTAKKIYQMDVPFWDDPDRTPLSRRS